MGPKIGPDGCNKHRPQRNSLPGVRKKILYKMYLQEVGWRRAIDWFDTVRDRDRQRAVVNAVTNLRVP